MGIRKVLAIFVLAGMLGGMFLAVASAADKNSNVIGMVDVEQILKDYKKKQDSDAQVQAYVKGLQDKFDLRNRNKLLSDAEITELETLKSKEKPTDQEKARITQLEDAEKARDGELKDLQAKKEPTDADRTRLAELQTQSKKADDNLAKLANEYSKMIENKRVELGNAITKDVLDAIKVVADEKKISTVVDKVAVLYGGEDITAAVVEKLNKAK